MAGISKVTIIDSPEKMRARNRIIIPQAPRELQIKTPRLLEGHPACSLIVAKALKRSSS